MNLCLKECSRRFSCIGIVPWNLEKVQMKKLIPGKLYEPPEELPLSEADKSFNKPRLSTSNAENEVEWQVKWIGEKQGEKQHEKKPEREPKVISIRKKKFKLIKVEEEKSEGEIR